MTHQIIISDVQNTTLCIPLESAKTLSQLHESIYRLSGIEPLLHRLLFNGFPLSESIYLEAIGNSSDFLNLKFVLSGGCNGGKGGFGSLLRNAKSSKKTTNFGSCRDLNGRKLRDVQYEKKLLEWKEKENNKKKEVEPLLSEKIKKNLSKNNKKEEENWQAETKNISLRVSESIEKGLAKQKQSDELKRKRDEAPIKLFGLMEDSISESDLSEEEEEEFEKKSKKHCSAGIKSTTTPTTTPTPSGLKSTTTLTTIATIATVDTAIAAVTTATTSTTIEASDSLSNLN